METLMDRPCVETHPTTGDCCVLEDGHNIANDPQDRQHLTVGGYKWPDLRVLAPEEGFNGPQPHRL